MATGTLKIAKNYGNIYEEQKDLLKHNPFYVEQDWRRMYDGNSQFDLDMYISILQNTDRIKDTSKFYTDYNYEHADMDTRVASLYNEIFANRDNVDTERTRPVKNEYGAIVLDENGKEVTETFKASDYEYYKSVLKEKNDINYEQWILDSEQERKESMSGFAKFMHGYFATNAEFLGGVFDVVDGITSLFGALGTATADFIKGDGTFSDSFVKSIASDNFRLFEGYHDTLEEFERRYTGFRDVNGNYTTLGTYLGGTVRTVGQMIPSILLAIATYGGSTAGSIVASGASKGLLATTAVGGATAAGSAAAQAATSSLISQSVYYGAMTTNNIRDMYTEFATNGVSVSSEQILTNAVIKTTLEISIEKLLGKLLGGTVLDNLMFGRTVGKNKGSNLLSSGIGRILKDAGQEGFEEVCQELSGWLTDTVYTSVINENFGKITDLTWENILASFVIGSVVSFGSSAVNVIRGKGKGITGKIKSYEQGISIESFVESFDELRRYLNKEDLTDSQRKTAEAAVVKMYESYRLISSMYGEMGEERFNSAVTILDKIKKNLDSGKYDIAANRENAIKVYDSLFETVKIGEISAAMSNLQKQKDTKRRETKDSDVKKIEEAGITELSEKAILKDEDVSHLIDQDDLIAKLSKVRKAVNGKFDIYLTKDGNNVVQIGDKILVPEKLIENGGDITVIATLAEQKIISDIKEDKRGIIKISLEDVHKTYEEFTGRKSTLDEALYSLVFDTNASLYRAVLATGNKDAYRLLEGIAQIIQDESVKDIEDAVYKKKLNTIFTNMRKALVEYLKIQNNADYHLDILTKAQINEIERSHWALSIYNKVVLGEQLTEQEELALVNRITYMNIEQDRKNVLLKNIKSGSSTVRIRTMAVVDDYYNNVFTTKYDGATYMPENSIANVAFNTFLQKLGLTLRTLGDANYLTDADKAYMSSEYSIKNMSALDYRRYQFLQSTNNFYTFNVNSKGDFTILETKTNKRKGFSLFKSNIEQIKSGKDLYNEKKHVPRTILDRALRRNDIVQSVLASDIPDVTKRMISIDDAIKDASLLNKDIVEKISESYGRVTPETTFMYMRSFIAENVPNLSIVVNPDNTYAFVDVSEMNSILKKKNVVIDDNTKISDIIKDKYLNGYLSGLKLIITDDNIVAEYRPYKLAKSPDNINKDIKIYDNAIYVNRKVAEEGGEYLKFVILHEFQHALQFENKMNLGMNCSWISEVNSKVKSEIISDVKAHMPSLFKRGDTQEQIEEKVSQFVYYSTGETDAYGVYTSQFTDFYPTTVSYTNYGTEVTFPWGESYVLSKDNKRLTGVNMSIIEAVDGLYEVEHLEELYKGIKFDDRVSDYKIRTTVAENKWEVLPPVDSPELYTIAQEIERWIRVPMNTAASVNEKFKNDLKKLLLTENGKKYKRETLEQLRRIIAPTVPFVEFVNMEIPFARFQQRDELRNSPFISVTAGVSSLNTLVACFKGFYNISSHGDDIRDTNLIIGTFRPWDSLCYIPSSESEILIAPQNVKNARMYRVKNYPNLYTHEGYLDKSGYMHDNVESYYFIDEDDESIPLQIREEHKRMSEELAQAFASGDSDLVSELSNDIDEFRKKHGKLSNYHLDTDTGEIMSLEYEERINLKHKSYEVLPELTSDTGEKLSDYTIGFRHFDSNDFTPMKRYVYEASLAQAEKMLVWDNTTDTPANIPAFDDSVIFKNVCISVDNSVKILNRCFLRNKVYPNITIHDIDTHRDYTIDQFMFNNYMFKYGYDYEIVNKDFEKFLHSTIAYDFEQDWAFLITDPEGRVITEEEVNTDLGVYIPKMSIEGPSDLQSKPKRYVSQKEAKGTNLEYFTHDYVKTQITPEMQKFINEADGIAEELQEKINGSKAGTLTRADVDDYFDKTDLDKMDVKTFKLINKCFYGNEVITTPKQLKKHIELTEKYFALGTMIAKEAGNEFLLNVPDEELLLSRIEWIESLPDSNKLKQQYTKLLIGISYYDFQKYRPAKIVDNKFYDVKMPEIPLDLDVRSLRSNWLKLFDGSIAKGLEIANTVKHASRLIYKHKLKPGDKEVSMDKDMSDSGDNMTLHDILTDDKDVENNLIRSLTESVNSIDFEAMEYEIRDSLTETTAKLIASKYGGDLQQSKGEILKYYKHIRNLSEKQLTEIYVSKMFAKILGVSLDVVLNNNTVQEQINKYERTAWSINNNIKSNVRTINKLLNRLTPKATKMFLEDEVAKKYFNDDLTLKEGVTTVDNPDLKKRNKNPKLYKSKEELQTIWDDMKYLIKNIRGDVYTTRKNFENYLKIQDTIKQQNADILAYYKDAKAKANKPVKTVKQIITVPVETSYREPAKYEFIAIDSPTPMPDILSKILTFEFTEQKQTKVKYFAEDGDMYTVTNIEKFLEANAEILNSLTEADAIRIMEFYLTTALSAHTMTEPQRATYNAIKEYLAYYIFERLDNGIFNIDSDLVRRFELHMEQIGSLSGQSLANRKAILSKLNPSDKIVQSISSHMGFELDEKVIEEMRKAVVLGDSKKIQIAKKKMYDSMLEQYKGQKKDFLDSVLKWQRIMMLSSPGTWIRNWLSNKTIGGFDINVKGKKYSVKGLEENSGILGDKLVNTTEKLILKLFPKKNLKTFDKQYKITGTVVTDDVKDFINRNLIRNNLLNEIKEGLSKYDARKVNNASSDLVQLIVRSIKSEIFYNHQSDNDKINWIYKKIYKYLSDDEAVTRTMLKYLGKMLTEDSQQFNKEHPELTYFSRGIDSKVAKVIADAYKYAAMEYMHKSNFFTKLEQDLFENSPKWLYFAYKQVLPFMSSSYNWFAEGLKYNPVGLIYSCIRYAKLENTISKLEGQEQKGLNTTPSRFAQYTAKKDIGKGVIGSIGFGIGVLLVALGMVKLDEKDDKYTIRVGDTSVDITDIFGTQGIFIGMSFAGSIINANDDENFATNFMDVLVSTLDSMFMDSSIQTLYDTFRWSSGVGDLITSIPMKTIDMLLPNLLTTIVSISKNYNIQYSEGFLGKLEKMAYQLVPFMDRFAPNKVDVYTGEAQSPIRAWYLFNFINQLTPLKVKPYDISELEKTAITLGVNKSSLTGNYKVQDEDVKLTASEIEKLNEFYGKLNNRRLTELLSDKLRVSVKNEKGDFSILTYSKMSDKQKNAAFKQIMSENGTYAKAYILTQKGYKYYTTESEYKELKLLGIGNIFKKTKTKNGFVK